MTETDGAVHTTQYQRWDGRLRGGRTWLAIAASGIWQRLRDPRSVVLLLGSVGLVIASWMLFYILSLLESLADSREAAGIYVFIRILMGVDIGEFAQSGSYRLPLWLSLFVLLNKLQMFYLLVLIGWLGPGLIAGDLRSNALPIYFARPITPWTYLLGKWLTMAAFIAIGMLLPNLLALAGGVLIAGGVPSWSEPLRMAGALTLSGGIVMLCGGAVILALSSLSPDRRLVTASWLAVALLPAMTRWAVKFEAGTGHVAGLLGSLSLGHNALHLTEWLLGVRDVWQETGLPVSVYESALGSKGDPLQPALVMLGVTILAFIVCYRRVVRFSRAAASL